MSTSKNIRAGFLLVLTTVAGSFLSGYAMYWGLGKAMWTTFTDSDPRSGYVKTESGSFQEIRSWKKIAQDEKEGKKAKQISAEEMERLAAPYERSRSADASTRRFWLGLFGGIYGILAMVAIVGLQRHAAMETKARMSYAIMAPVGIAFVAILIVLGGHFGRQHIHFISTLNASDIFLYVLACGGTFLALCLVGILFAGVAMFFQKPERPDTYDR